MCGIAGVIGDERALDVAAVQHALRHRGPDSAGHATGSGPDGAWRFVHTRLAINDLSPAGDQPLSSEDGRVSMIFNGEIYNSPELRQWCEARGHRFASHSDGEVIVHLWEEVGTKAFAMLNGIFAVALVDRASGEMVLARDPFGVKPLFYAVDDGSLWFASELAALKVATGGDLGELDTVALAQFLTFLWIPDPSTPYQGARSLLPGHLLRMQDGRPVIEAYVDLPAEVGETVSVASARAEVRDRVEAAVRRQLLSDVPVAVMASGGIDSSLIWWAAADSVERAYTIDWVGQRSLEGVEEDTAAARLLAAHFGTPLSLVDPSPPKASGDGAGDLFADPAYDLARAIAAQAREDGFKVLFSGQGGDELFGGYRRHRIANLLGRAPVPMLGDLAARMLARAAGDRLGPEYAARALRAATQRDTLAGYMHLCSYSSAEDRAQALGCSTAEVADEVVWARHREVWESLPRGWSRLRKARTLDLLVYMPGLGLSYVDRAGMEFGVEIRVPLLDLELARWALRLPDAVLCDRRQTKIALRSLAAEVLPPHIATRPKRGFGSPAEHVRGKQGDVGSRGFRQAAYFGLANRTLDAFVGAREA